MPNPIMASSVETPKRPRMYVGVNTNLTLDSVACDTSLAWPTLKEAQEHSDVGSPIFALPGTDDEWTVERIKNAARKFCMDAGWEESGNPAVLDQYITDLVCFATEHLGLGEQT